MDGRNLVGSSDGRYKYTGKERDAETGYDYFGARCYDARIGRWLSVDPHQGKYPSSSSYGFAANNPISAVDRDGRDVIVLFAPKGANGFGHAAMLIGSNETGWYYYSKDGTSWIDKLMGPPKADIGRYFANLAEFAQLVNNSKEHREAPYEAAYRIPTDPDDDPLMRNIAKEDIQRLYFVIGANCIDAVSRTLEGIGLNGGNSPAFSDAGKGFIHHLLRPAARFQAIKKRNPGVDVSAQLKWTKDERTEIVNYLQTLFPWADVIPGVALRRAVAAASVAEDYMRTH